MVVRGKHGGTFLSLGLLQQRLNGSSQRGYRDIPVGGELVGVRVGTMILESLSTPLAVCVQMGIASVSTGMDLKPPWFPDCRDNWGVGGRGGELAQAP